MAKVKSNLKTKRKTYVKEWRKHRRLTQEQLAERIEVTAGAISQLEKGKMAYTQPMLEALADALGCQPVDLMIRNPLEPDNPWTIWETLTPTQRKQAVAILTALKATGT